jgi:hypothetical protein
VTARDLQSDQQNTQSHLAYLFTAVAGGRRTARSRRCSVPGAPLRVMDAGERPSRIHAAAAEGLDHVGHEPRDHPSVGMDEQVDFRGPRMNRRKGAGLHAPDQSTGTCLDQYGSLPTERPMFTAAEPAPLTPDAFVFAILPLAKSPSERLYRDHTGTVPGTQRHLSRANRIAHPLSVSASPGQAPTSTVF